MREIRERTGILIRLDTCNRGHGNANLYRHEFSISFRKHPRFGDGVQLRFYHPKVQNQPGFWSKPTFVPSFRYDSRLCTVEWLRLYLRLTDSLPLARDRQVLHIPGVPDPSQPTVVTALFVALAKRGGSYSSVGRDCLNNDVKRVLEAVPDSAIDTKTYTGHSTRHASFSLAVANGCPLALACEHGDISEGTLKDSYLRPIADLVPRPEGVSLPCTSATPLSLFLRLRFLPSASGHGVVQSCTRLSEEESLDGARPQAEALV